MALCTHSMSVESGRALEVLEAELAEEDLGETSEVRRVGGRVPHTHLVAAKLHQTKSIVTPSLSSSSSPLEYIGCGEYGKQRPYKSHDHKEKETHQHLLSDSTSFLEEIEVSGGGVALQVHQTPPTEGPTPSLVGDDHIVKLVDPGQLEGADGGGGQGVNG